MFCLLGKCRPICEPEIGVRFPHSYWGVLCAVEVYCYWEMIKVEFDVGAPVGICGEVSRYEG